MNSADTRSIDEIDCRTTVTRLWDFVDRELDGVRAAEVDAHLRHCTECAEHFEFARTFLDRVAASWPEPGETERLRVHVVRRLREEGFGHG